MHTIRGRLAVWYAVAIGATILAFAGIIYSVQRSRSFAELDSRIRLQSDLIATILSESYRARDAVVAFDPTTNRMGLVPDVQALLEVVRDYVLVLGEDNEIVFLSADARALPFSDVARLGENVDRSGGGLPGYGLLDLGPPVGELRYFVRPVANAGPSVQAVLSGAPRATGALGAQRLLTAMLLIAPWVVAASTVIGYSLVGRALKSVDTIVDEVEAITDGRSLHKRLAQPTTEDELARLTVTLNAMMGRLERSFRMLRRFTADASHELKTPLTVLRTGVERALTHPAAPEEVLEILEELLVEVSWMSELVDSLLTLARADEGRAPLHLDKVDLRDILSEVSETASILGEEAAVNVEVEVPHAPAVLEVDRSRIRQLLMNLLTNAIKYTPAGGRVSIDSKSMNGAVVINVRDTGIGIAPGELAHIFDRFWRADPARSRIGERAGAGLGLAISKWIAEAHGGAITVQSRQKRGTTFTVTLPLAQDGMEGAAADS
jgi:signal transduction histidine kinase